MLFADEWATQVTDEIVIDLLPAQDDFVFSDSPNPALVGGLGSGKSKAGIFRLVILMMDEPGINTLYAMPTYDLLKLRAIPGFIDDLTKLEVNFKINKSDYCIYVEGYGNIYLRSYDNPNRFIAFEVAHSVVDEIDSLDVPVEKADLIWRKVTERTRQKTKRGNTIGAVTSPDHGVHGFVYNRWVRNVTKRQQLIKAKTTDNPFLPPGYVDQIRENYDETLAELYINGEFVNLTSHKVYHFFDRQKHHTTRTLSKDDTVIHIGLDFNIGGCCACVAVIENNNPIFVDEFVSYDTREFVNNLAARYKDKKIIVYPDASGAAGSTNASESDIAIIQRSGYQVHAMPANPAVRDRVNACNVLFSHDRLKINTDKCQQLTNAIESQGYNARGEPEKFDKHPSIDDWVDGFGYFLAYKWPVRNAMVRPARTSGGI